MRKTFAASAILLAAALVGCEPTGKTPAEPSTSVSDVAVAPTKEQTRDNMREWHKSGGDAVLVPLVADLELADDDWRTDQFKRDGLKSVVHKDLAAAKQYRPVPDTEGQKYWADFLNTMQKVDDNLVLGNWDTAYQGLKDADKAYKRFYDRNQLIFSGK